MIPPSLILLGESSSVHKEFPEAEDIILYKGFNPSQEIVSARTLNTKVFKRENGRLVYRIFACPVHYVNEHGILEDLQNSCSCCSDWEIGESYSGYADGLFEDKYICGAGATYIQVNEFYFYRGFVEFNTEAIPDTTTTDSVVLNLYCIQWIITNEDHDIWSMENRPSSSGAMTVYNDAADGSSYVSNYLGGTGLNSWDLGAQACQDMEDLLNEDWFAVGISGYYSSSASYTLLYQCGTGWIDVNEPVGVEKNYDERQRCLTFLQNQPNPFTTKTEIRVSLDPEVLGTEGQIAEIRDQMTDDKKHMLLKIYDVTGRCIKNFPISNLQFPIRLEWDGTDDKGNIVPNGTYFYQLNVGNKSITKSMTLIR